MIVFSAVLHCTALLVCFTIASRKMCYLFIDLYWGYGTIWTIVQFSSTLYLLRWRHNATRRLAVSLLCSLLLRVYQQQIAGRYNLDVCIHGWQRVSINITEIKVGIVYALTFRNYWMLCYNMFILFYFFTLLLYKAIVGEIWPNIFYISVTLEICKFLLNLYILWIYLTLF